MKIFLKNGNAYSLKACRCLTYFELVIGLEVFVTKADGTRQAFDREKVVRTCLRFGADVRVADEVAGKVEERLYEGISSKSILRMIFAFMRRYRPEVGHIFDLRKALSLMSPKPEFELFGRVVLAHEGFDVKPNQILIGECGEHEVDAVAVKNGVTFFVEAKHHLSYHALTGLDESRIARAILEDVTEGFKSGRCKVKIDRAMIVTNTRYSEHATRYGQCRGIIQYGWSSPENYGLQHMIEEKRLYPLSCLRRLRKDVRLSLVNSGIVLISQFLGEDRRELEKKTGLSQVTIREALEDARSSASAFLYL
jgi:hypothetical protein